MGRRAAGGDGEPYAACEHNQGRRYGLDKAIHVACWAHARRKFSDIKHRHPLALALVEDIQRLYAVEDAGRWGSDADRHRLRQEHSRAIIDRIGERLNAAVAGRLPAADLGQASDTDHELIASAIGPCHGPEVEDFLANAPAVAGGRSLDLNHPIMADVLDAIGTEVHGYMKLDEERDGRARITPKRGSTAERLQVIYDLIERHLS